ncbi:MAG: NACHT domain-containing protein, partial [Flavobacterium sp.]
KKEFIKLNKQYVELFGIENLVVLENVAIEVLDGDRLLASLENFRFDDEDAERQMSIPSSQAARVDSVLNIAKDLNRFIIIGEPGSGKTTTLLKIQYEEASSAFKGVLNSRLPVFINANSYGVEQTFKDLITAKLDFDDLNNVLSNHKVVIIIDGLNEISEDLKKQAFNELNHLMDVYETVGFIITSRKFGFYNYWGLPVYELKALNETQINQLITNVLGYERSVNLWSQIISNRQIFELCHNPLMLMMVIKVSSMQDGRIPHNKGLLYQLFNETILARERKLYFTNPTTKKNLMSHLAFWMRENGMFRRVNINIARGLIENKLKVIDTSIGVNEILDELRNI